MADTFIKYGWIAKGFRSVRSEDNRKPFLAKKFVSLLGLYENLHISDVDECVDSPCGDGVPCINVEGSYSCRCLPGWSGQNCTEGGTSCYCYCR